MMVDFLKKQGYLFICLGLLALLVIALFWALSIGTVKLPLVNIYNTVVEQLFSGQPIEGVDRGPVHDIVWLLRLPRLVLAALVGMGLSVCSVIMQVVELDPDVIFVVVTEFNYGHEQDVLDRVNKHKALKNLRCVKEGRVVALPLYAIYSSGVRTYDGIKIIAAGMYPDLYKEK